MAKPAGDWTITCGDQMLFARLNWRVSICRNGLRSFQSTQGCGLVSEFKKKLRQSRTVKPFIVCSTLLLFLSVCRTSADAQSGYQVIVNQSNSTSELTKSLVSDFFLKKETRWSHGPKVVPRDQAKSRSVREMFSLDVHKKSVSAVNAYWNKMVFSGRNTPPQALDSDEQVMRFVSTNSGAIAYVSTTTTLMNGVKAIRLN